MKPAVFLDRDGTITKGTHLITSPEELGLEEGAVDGIKLFNTIGLKVIVVTNQPQIARGMCSEEDVNKINQKMLQELSNRGAKVDAVYFCPHHPEMHPDVPEHAKRYRIECECRKPNTGMLKQAAEKFDLDLSNSFVIGDRTVDVQTGRNAGCRTILVKTGVAGEDKKYSVVADYEAEDLLQAAKIIKNSPVKAVILAGGRGERLRPITDSIPKPMIEIGGKPLLQHQIDALKRSGITDIVICGSYLVEKIKNYFGDGSEFGMKIHYPDEPQPLGSGGAIRNAYQYLKDAERIVIINGDKMLGGDFDFDRMIEFDRKKEGFATVLVRCTDHPHDSDILKIGTNEKVEAFIGRGQSLYNISNSGIIITTPKIIDNIPEGKSNIEKDVIFSLIGEKDIYGFMLPDGWFTKDIGTPDRLEKVKWEFKMIS